MPIVSLYFGKKSKERIVYFSNYCKEKILEYLNTRDIRNIKDNKALFINRYGNRIGIDAVENICKKAYKLLKLDESYYTTHTLRHTAATIMYTYVKDDVLLLKEFLGHSSLASTQIYTHLSNNKIREAIENNPLNNYKRGE
nr:MAG TPA: SITE SPECIFIC RECOMBINASE XERD [Caudoviricetes sp.]